MKVKVNQVIKTGANVYLTGEDIAVHGDLHFVSTFGRGITMVLNYVTPHTCVGLGADDPWPEKYDAVFDTQRIDKERTEGFLDIPTGTNRGVMVCHDEYCHISKNLPMPEGYGPNRPPEDVDINKFLSELAGHLGIPGDADVKVLRLDRNGTVEEVDINENKGTLQ